MRRLALLFAALVLLSGCRVATDVDVHVNSDGGGLVAAEVTLDAEAARTVPDLAQRLRVSDLEANGWQVDEPERADDGRVIVRASRPFSDADEANEIMSQLSGPGGPFRDLRLSQQRSLTEVYSQFTGTVDLSRGIDSFGEQILVERTGSPLGFDAADAERRLGYDWEANFPVTMAVHLPGERVSEPAPAADGRWTLPYGQTTTLSAAATGPNVWPLTFFGVAVAAILAALVLWRLTRYRPQHKGRGVSARDALREGVTVPT